MNAGRARGSGDGPRLVVQAWLGSRLLLVLVGVAVMLTSNRSLADVAGNWDVQHFLRIAREGYLERKEVAFFPGLPMLLRLADGLGADPILVGIVASLIASIFAAWALYRLGGPQAGVIAAAAWLIAPTTVFTVVAYTESLFCGFAFWAWVKARDDRWGQAALLAAAACAFRVSGIFLIAGLGVLALTAPGRRWRRLEWLLLPALVPAGYALYLRLTQGSWTAWYAAQAEGWSRGLTWPWQSIANTIPAILPGAYADHPGWAWVFRAELVSLLVGLVTTTACLATRRWGEATWVGVQVLAFTTSYWLMSVNRAVLLWFPLWVLLGEWTVGGRTGSRRTVAIVAAVLSVLVMIWWAHLFYTGGWAS